MFEIQLWESKIGVVEAKIGTEITVAMGCAVALTNDKLDHSSDFLPRPGESALGDLTCG